MRQDERSRLSREQILEAALRLFSRQGYGGTSIRDIADVAGCSTGSVYHQFADKETIFRTLLERYGKAVESPEFPLNQALLRGDFPDDLEGLAGAARESVEQYLPYVSLVYVDVVEFGGAHVRGMVEGLSGRISTFLEAHRERLGLARRLDPGVSPLSAVMLATRFFLSYFTVEVLFGVPDHFGTSTDQAVKEIADIFRRGVVVRAQPR